MTSYSLPEAADAFLSSYFELPLGEEDWKLIVPIDIPILFQSALLVGYFSEKPQTPSHGGVIRSDRDKKSVKFWLTPAGERRLGILKAG